MKRKIFLMSLLAATLAGLFRLPVHAAVTLYEFRETTVLAKGVTYEKNRQITDAGMLDVYVLTVPLNDPYISIAPVESQRELGLKETTLNLLSGATAIAGVNGDFFGMAGSYSVPTGPMAADGRLKSVTRETNQNVNEFATFFLDSNNNPFMRYIKSEVYFLIDGRENVPVIAYNRIGAQLDKPVVIDRQAMTNTAALDARISGSLKIVVDGDEITYVSKRGETVDVPENGYLVVIPSLWIASYERFIKEGLTAQLFFSNNFGIDFDSLKSAIGGGGLILASGQTVRDKGIAAAGRHPRTAIGITSDKKNLILMAVDGRTHSIGATHEEMAGLLRRYGAYDAMHLDGGGSTTMVVQQAEGRYEVVNTPSDGAQRRIINALGVFDRSPVGELHTLGLRLSQEAAFVGMPVTAEVFGQDAYLHSLDLPDDAEVHLSVSNDIGTWNDSAYIPAKPGTIMLEARYHDLTALATLKVSELTELRSATQSLRLTEGGEAVLTFSGITPDGEQIAINSGVSVTVNPPNLGVVEDGRFIARSTGVGYLECSLSGVNTYIRVSVGQTVSPINALSYRTPINFSGSANQVGGNVQWDTEEGRNVLRLHYEFTPGNETRAAYLNFTNPSTLPGEPSALRMSVKGDGSGNWLRGRIIAAGGRTYTIDFAREVDFEGWQTCTAVLPSEVQYPVKLERLYIANLTSDHYQFYDVLFANMEGIYSPVNNLVLPQSQKFKDPMQAVLYNTSPPADAMDIDLSVPVKKGQDYAMAQYGNTVIMRLSAAKGGLYATDANQWRWLNAETLFADNIVLILDMDPAQFSQSREYALFHDMLADKKSQKVFVVYTGDNQTVCEIRDGVRYISLARQEGESNIRFRLQGNQIQFDAGVPYPVAF